MTAMWLSCRPAVSFLSAFRGSFSRKTFPCSQMNRKPSCRAGRLCLLLGEGACCGKRSGLLFIQDRKGTAGASAFLTVGRAMLAIPAALHMQGIRPEFSFCVKMLNLWVKRRAHARHEGQGGAVTSAWNAPLCECLLALGDPVPAKRFLVPK